MAGAGAGGRGLDPGLLAQVLEPQLACGSASAWSAREGEVERVVEQLEAAQAGAEALADALEFEEQDEVELAGPQARRDLLGLALGEGHLDPGVGGAEAGDRLRHQRRAGGREGGGPQAAAAAGGDRRDLVLGRLHLGEDPADVAGQRGAGRGRPDAAAAALDQRRPGFALERGDRLGDGRLRVGEGVGGRREGAVGDDLAEDVEPAHIRA